MGFHFFAYLNRMKFIKRWSLMHATTSENIMEHSEQVAQIAYALGLINNRVCHGTVSPDRCASLAVFHECSEVITGDLPTPIKYFNAEIRTAYKKLEGVANEKLLSMIPEEFRNDYHSLIVPDETSYEWKLVKAADKLSAYIKCLEELKSGNKEFEKAEATIRAELDQNPLPETEYFRQVFLPGFRLTLDELD